MLQLYVLVHRVIHFLELKVVLITIVVRSIPLDIASLDKVLKLENLVLQIFELFLIRSNRLYRVVSVQLILYYNIR